MALENRKYDVFKTKATVIGQCGDSITTRLTIKNNAISDIEQNHDGCVYTAMCSAITSSISKNLPLEEALEINPEMVIRRIINLPKDHFHCASLAVNSLGEAISKYYSNKGQKNKLIKSKNMINTAVIATDSNNNLEKLGKYLAENMCNEVKFSSDLELIMDNIVNQSTLLIIKEHSLSFDSSKLVRKVIQANAFANIAILSNTNPKEFEDKFEGFGILMQLSDPPNEYETEMLCKKLHECLASLKEEV